MAILPYFSRGGLAKAVGILYARSVARRKGFGTFIVSCFELRTQYPLQGRYNIGELPVHSN